MGGPMALSGTRRPQERPDANNKGRPQGSVGQRAAALFLVAFFFDLCRLTTILAPGSRNERERERNNIDS